MAERNAVAHQLFIYSAMLPVTTGVVKATCARSAQSTDYQKGHELEDCGFKSHF